MLSNFNHQKIGQSLFVDLSPRQKEIIFRRFGLDGKERETLEAVGQSLGLTRERVRQIVGVALAKIKNSQISLEIKGVLSDFKKYLQDNGGLKREDLLFTEPAFLGQPNSANWINFLFQLEGSFIRGGETKEFYPFWTVDQRAAQIAEKTVASIKRTLEREKKLMSLNELAVLLSETKRVRFLKSTLEISKEILKTNEGKYGLRTWPEVNPRGVKDLALIVFRKFKKPLHFVDVANKIDELLLGTKAGEFSIVSASVPAKKTNFQTVHNELIKNPQFVLVGRGVYALKEWGYTDGTVKDIISGILKDAKKPLKQEEILKKVLSQRLVKESTILLNLGNKKCFLKSGGGRYCLREA
jgi:hypothetical protein